jgi:hypothetical protein
MRQINEAEESAQHLTGKSLSKPEDIFTVARIGSGCIYTSGSRISQSNNKKRVWLTLVIAISFFLSGCSTTPRLNVNFDADGFGSPPSASPLPNPPLDVLSWTVTQQVTSTVVPDPAGGGWLRITPSPGFIASPEMRKRAIIATSERFTTSPPAKIRGSLRLRIDGGGTVTVAFRPLQGSQFSDFIGGIQLANFGVNQGQAHIVHGFSQTRSEDIYWLPTGGKIADYQPGTVVKIFWSIDQDSRTFHAGAGGPSPSTNFTSVSAGVATTPIQQLSLWVWLERPSFNTAIFIDDLLAEEYR